MLRHVIFRTALPKRPTTQISQIRFFCVGVGGAPPSVPTKMKLSRMRSINESGQRKEKIVILGSGWAGYRLLKDLNTGDKYTAFMVSPRNHFLFTPLLASAAVGASQMNSICSPIRPLCTTKNARFYEGKAISVDKKTKVVHCKTADGLPFPIEYDKLVIATGFQANDFGIKNLDKYAFFMKETGDAQRLHNHILRQFEEASLIHILDGDSSLSPDEEESIRKCLSFVIVGGGPTGVEFAGELTDFLIRDINRMYPHLIDYWTVSLCDGLPVLLGPFQNKKLQDHAANHLMNKQKVNLYLNDGVTSVEKNELLLKSGIKLPFSTLVWCAGIKPLPFVADLDVPKDIKGKQILTEKTLNVVGEKDIYAIGDVATIKDFWLPQTAQIANQQAAYLANIFNKKKVPKDPVNPRLEEIHDPTLEKPFQNTDKGVMAYLGGTSAIMKTPGILPNLTGRLGWFSWRSVYWTLQLTMRNRVNLTFSWVTVYFFGRDLNRVGDYSHPVVRKKSVPDPTKEEKSEK